MKVKRGKARIRSQASKDKRPQNLMSMGRKVTRSLYESRDITQRKPSKKAQVAKNKAVLDALQSTMRSIRSSQ